MKSITLNGEQRKTAAKTVRDLIVELSLTQQRFAIEINRAILPRSEYDRFLVDGDQVEIVIAIGGG